MNRPRRVKLLPRVELDAVSTIMDVDDAKPNVDNRHSQESCQKLGGEQAPYLDLAARVVDHKNHVLYLFGGCSTDRPGYPTAHLHRLRLSHFAWEDLTSKLKYSEEEPIGDPMLTPMKLPARVNASMELYQRGGVTYLIIFGGRGEDDRAAHHIFAVDTDSLTWTKLDTEPGVPRVGASTVLREEDLYIFGGWTGIDDAVHLLNTYSVFNLRDRKWSIYEGQYLANQSRLDIGDLGYNIRSVSLFDGRKFLLFRGKGVLNDDEAVDTPLEIAPHDIFIFDPRAGIMQVQEQTQSADHSFPICCSWCDISHTPTYGREVLLCAWRPTEYESDDLEIEIYQYNPFPADTLQCLGIRQWIWELNQDLQMFELIGDRAFLFGNQPRVGEARAWNICVDLTERLKAACAS